MPLNTQYIYCNISDLKGLQELIKKRYTVRASSKILSQNIVISLTFLQGEDGTKDVVSDGKIRADVYVYLLFTEALQPQKLKVVGASGLPAGIAHALLLILTRPVRGYPWTPASWVSWAITVMMAFEVTFLFSNTFSFIVGKYKYKYILL
jgi:hypothetical protein